MPEFTYTGLKNDTGKTIKGNINADNDQEARDKINAQGVTVMEIAEATAASKKSKRAHQCMRRWKTTSVCRASSQR